MVQICQEYVYNSVEALILQESTSHLLSCSAHSLNLFGVHAAESSAVFLEHVLSRLVVVSLEAKKKQHARASSGLRNHGHYSELFTRMAALKL